MNKKVEKILSYVRAGQLPLMIGLFPFFVGSNITNLEILRERLNVAVHKKMERRFWGLKVNINFNSEVKRHFKDRPIWFMWLQGIENAPNLPKSNYNYLKSKFGLRVNLITQQNISDYIDLPQTILSKYEKGVISKTHFSDLVRIQLLSTYGGTWVDSTVFVKTEFIDSIPDFVIPQTYKPGRDGNVIPVSNWFINSKAQNPILIRTRDLLFEYWNTYNYAIDYFIFHHLLIISSDENNHYLDKIIPIDNSMPHYLMLKMRKEEMSKEQIKTLFDAFDLMKFTNKFDNEVEKRNYEILVQIIDEL